MSDPREMYDFLWLTRMTGSVQLRPNGTAEAGKIYPAPDGHRFFYGTYHPDAIYCLVKANPGHEAKAGKFFQQNINSFAEDVGRHGYSGELRLGATKNVIEGFMDIFMGVLSVTSGPVALGIAGMNMLVSAGKVKQDWDVYKDAIEVMLYERKFIEERAPMLSNVVLIELLFGQLEKILTGKAKGALTGAMPGPKVAGKIAGVFLGKFGEDQFKARLKTVNTLFKEVLIKVVDHASTHPSEKLSGDQVTKLAHHHVLPILNKNGYIKYLDQATGEKIIREVSEKWVGLNGPFQKISKALDKIV